MLNGLTLQGERELAFALNRLADIARDEVAEAALLAGAEPIEQAAESKAPRRTGQLSRSIDHEVSKEAGDVEVAVGPTKDGFYGVFHEFGPRPFMRPAFDEQKDAATDRIKDRLADEIQKVVSGAG